MEITIGPYILSQRTEYSKMHLFDKNTGKDITEDNRKILNKITEDYNKQKYDSDSYFEIYNNSIISYFKRNDIDYLFIPDGITSIASFGIEQNGFSYVSLPDTLTTIGEYSFYNCICLKEIDIPNTVKQIGASAFLGCSALKHINLPESLDRINDRVFSKCKSLESIILPDSIRTIEKYAFSLCVNLKEVKFSKNLIGINECAFARCEGLESIDLPDKLTEIEEECFLGCESLKEVIVPDSVRRICPRAFSGCFNLESIKLPNNILTLSDEIFNMCIRLKNITLPDNIFRFGSYMFSSTEDLENVNIPKMFSQTDSVPFEYSSIKSLTFNHDLTAIHLTKDDLIYKSNIYKLIINNNVKTITPEAFKCSGSQITSIDYLGTNEEFENFKKNNEELFKVLPNINEINFIKNIEKTYINDEYSIR